MSKADIGLIGLAVMGENLVLNMESKGFTVAVFNLSLIHILSSLRNRNGYILLLLKDLFLIEI